MKDSVFQIAAKRGCAERARSTRHASTTRWRLVPALVGCLLAACGDQDEPATELGELSQSLQTATFSLINVDTGLPISTYDPIANGATITLSALPSRNLSIRANPTGTVGSVTLALDGAARTDSSSPYSLCGDRRGVYSVCTAINTTASHSVSATLYSARGGTGSALGTASVSFSVRETGGTTTSAPSIVSFGASPATVTAGGSSVLSWSATGATSLTIDQGVGTVTGNSVSVAPTATKLYTLTATNSAGSVTRQTSVTVQAAGTGTDTRSAGCGLTGKPKGDFFLTTTDGNGTTRTYEVLVPTGYDPATALSLAFVYHGAGGNESSAKAFGLQNAPGAAAGGIFVFPRGVPYNGGTIGWQDSCGGYDMVFYDRMRSYLEANYCINPKRVFATGFSWGGDFVTALNCCRGDRLRAVAPASCSDEYGNQNDYTTYANLPCPVAQAGAIRFTHQVSGDDGYPSPFFATTSALYRSFNGCSSASTATSPSPCVAFSGCRQPYLECAYQGIGHALPSNWAADTWSFFASQP